MRSFCETVAHEFKKENEDFSYESSGEDPMPLFVVGDFMSSDSNGVSKQAVHSLKDILSHISHLPPRQLLSQLANELDQAIYRAFGKLEFTFAAGVIEDGNQLCYLTIGDCCINVYHNGVLQLLNGSMWECPSSTVATHHRPARPHQQSSRIVTRGMKMGRGTIALQSMSVEVFQLEKNDLVVFFSDGVERNLNPVERLNIIEEVSSTEGIKDPEAIVKRTLKEVAQRGGGDDSTLLVVAGPFESRLANEAERTQSQINELSKEQQVTRSLVEGNLTETKNHLGGIVTVLNQLEQKTGSPITPDDLSESLTRLQNDLTTCVNEAQQSLDAKMTTLRETTHEALQQIGVPAELKAIAESSLEFQSGIKDFQHLMASFSEEVKLLNPLSDQVAAFVTGASINNLVATINKVEGWVQGIQRTLEDQVKAGEMAAHSLQNGGELEQQAAQPASGEPQSQSSQPPQALINFKITERLLEKINAEVRPYVLQKLQQFKGQSFSKEKFLSLLEKEITAEEFGLEKASSIRSLILKEAKQKTISTPGKVKWWTNAKRFATRRNIALLVLLSVTVLGVLVGIKMLGRDESPPQNVASAQGQSGGQFRISMRPDGRSLEITKEGKWKSHSNYVLNSERVTFHGGDESIEMFISGDEMMQFLAGWKELGLVFSSVEDLVKAKPGLAAYRVKDSDVRDDGGNRKSPCDAIAKQFKMEKPDELQRLNPGLDCPKLEPGDVLLVKPASEERRPRMTKPKPKSPQQ